MKVIYDVLVVVACTIIVMYVILSLTAFTDVLVHDYLL